MPFSCLWFDAIPYRPRSPGSCARIHEMAKGMVAVNPATMRRNYALVAYDIL